MAEKAQATFRRKAKAAPSGHAGSVASSVKNFGRQQEAFPTKFEMLERSNKALQEYIRDLRRAIAFLLVVLVIVVLASILV